MFQMHIAYSLELLVLAAGLVLIYYGAKQNSQVLKIGGYILTVITVLNMLCTLYYGMRYWEDGFFRTPSGQQSMASPMGMMGNGMMPNMMGGKDGGGMMCGDMMKKMMDKKSKNQMSDDAQSESEQIPAGVSPEEHEAHHPQGQ